MLKKNYDITDKLTAREMEKVGIETINKQQQNNNNKQQQTYYIKYSTDLGFLPIPLVQCSMLNFF